MEEIIKMANELGLMIKGSDIYKRFEEISMRLDKNTEERNLLEEYARLSEDLYQKETKGSVIEVHEKQKLQELSEKVSRSQLIKEYIATQSYFMNMMMQVQRVISEPQGEPRDQSRIIKPDGSSKIITDL